MIFPYIGYKSTIFSDQSVEKGILHMKFQWNNKKHMKCHYCENKKPKKPSSTMSTWKIRENLNPTIFFYLIRWTIRWVGDKPKNNLLKTLFWQMQTQIQE